MHGPAAGQHVVGRASGQHVPGPNRHHRFFSHAGGPTTHYARPGLVSLSDRLGPALIATDVQAGAMDVNEGTIAIIATDVAEEEGLRVVPLSTALSGKLREILPSHCIVGNPLDLTGDTDASRYRNVLDAAGEEFDVVMTIFGDPIPGASEVIRPGRCELVAYLGGADVERAERLLFHEKKIAVFPTPERAVKALSCHVRFHRDRFPLSVEGAGHGEGPPAKGMSPADAMEFLARAGFPLTRFRSAGTEDEAAAAARGIGFPVAVKMNSPDVTHKSDAGGVFLDVPDDAGVRTAFREIRKAEERLGARAGGALVCAMAPAGHEVIVGVTKDPQFGHAVMFGLGGIFVEVMKDVSFRVAPLSKNDAAEMIREIRGYRALTGLRGKPAGDLDALGKLLLQLSAFLASHPEIEELDLNPVIVHARGLSIADARIVRGG